MCFDEADGMPVMQSPTIDQTSGRGLVLVEALSENFSTWGLDDMGKVKSTPRDSSLDTPLAIREKYHLTDFYPHITLGFTKRDLHFEDGVRKDKSTCVADLNLADD